MYSLYLLCSSLMHTLFSWIKMVLPMHCSSFLNSWHFFGDIFILFLSNAFNISSSFIMWDCFEGVNNSKSSILASQYFLLSRQLRMVFIYVCQICGETFSPIGILWYKYKALPKYSKIPQYFFEIYDVKEQKASFKSNTEKTSHLEFPNIANMAFINRYAKLFLVILVFKCLKSVTTFLSCVIFLLINITGFE